MQFYSKIEHRPTGGTNEAVNHTANQVICQKIALKKNSPKGTNTTNTAGGG